MSEYKSEKAFTRNQLRKLVYEEVYMNNDMTIDNYNPNTGYQLNYPQFFSSNPSQDKSIAPRRIQVSPSSHQFRLCISYKDAALQVHSTNTYFLVDVLQDNTTQEILNFIRENSVCQDGETTFALRSLYDKMTGELSFMAYDITNMQQVDFRFMCPSFDDYAGFWMFLNQINVPFANIQLDQNYTQNSLDYTMMYSISNVWNRETLYVHSSFSNSQHHYLCLSNEFWEKPSKLFYGNVNDNAFYIYFTTDGVNKIIPYYANKLLELSFVLRTNQL